MDANEIERHIEVAERNLKFTGYALSETVQPLINDLRAVLTDLAAANARADVAESRLAMGKNFVYDRKCAVLQPSCGYWMEFIDILRYVNETFRVFVGPFDEIAPNHDTAFAAAQALADGGDDRFERARAICAEGATDAA